MPSNAWKYDLQKFDEIVFYGFHYESSQVLELISNAGIDSPPLARPLILLSFKNVYLNRALSLA